MNKKESNVVAIFPQILSLCSGYGGLDLGVELAVGGDVVCHVEREAYAAANLVARMEDKTLPQAPIWDDLKTFDGNAWRGAIDCVTAGYPCQPFSLAGNRLGDTDPRHLWPDVRRIVDEIRPQFCFFENVANHLNMGFDTVSRELQEMGYSVAATLVTAAEVGAPHKRERLFILAVSNTVSVPEWIKQERERWKGRKEPTELTNNCKELANSESEFGGSLQRRTTEPHGGRELTSSGAIFPPGQDPGDPNWSRWPWLSFKPGFRRSSYGASKWNDRLRLCGNGVVPLAAAYAFGILAHDLGIRKNSF